MELINLKGVGEKTVEKLNSLGIYSVMDLCKFLPSNYLDMTKVSEPKDIVEGDYFLIKVTCLECAALRSKSSRAQYVKAVCDSNGSRVEILWFNMPYIIGAFKKGEWLIWGKFTFESGVYTTFNPSYADVNNKLKLCGVMPIYPLKSLIGSTVFRKIMENALLENLLESALPDKYNLNDLYTTAHFPQTLPQVFAAHTELAMYNVILDLLKYRTSRQPAKLCAPLHCEIDADILSKLPYVLTESQQNTLDEVLEGINCPTAMNRLILGDVGSGKTIVALLAMSAVAQAGKQSVLMCPTEILCMQHYNNAVMLFGVDNITLLMGSLSMENKKNVVNSIYRGQSKMIFATQSCISNSIRYKDLRLIVIDESHKFGVNQKGRLENKGGEVNTLIMSATPLPRSLAMIMYDDLRVSKIARRSENADNVKSYVFNSDKLEKMYRYIAQKAKSGEKVYLICPRLNDCDGKEIFSVKSVYKHIVEKYLQSDMVSMLHGGIKDGTRGDIMESFSHGGVNLLIATTVVEVGVDVPQANTMVILAADCFGLASLHQLRGRIGRDGKAAECFFHTRSHNAPERIVAIKDCNDGLKLAEIDAELRGYGDVIGNNQSGKNKYENFLCKVTMDMVKKAKAIADKIDVESIDYKFSDEKDLTDIVLN